MAKKKVEPVVVKPTVKIEEKIFAGKKVLREYEKDGGKFVELEGGETIKL